ncbi:MAG: hypothetical protein NTZ93_03295 [Candidatus Beckwithbacteria bacterium]|nr:hypothetical protein [Candidatus Beckwithbacteria bacterium]
MPKKHLNKISGKNLLASASLAGSLLLTSGSQSLKALPDKPPELRLPLGLVNDEEIKKILSKYLNKVLPSFNRVLTEKEELSITQAIQKTLGIKAVAELEGKRLNNQIGLIGLEQHLLRYPGDTLEGRSFPQVGLAPGTGAWGYFASSAEALAKVDREREKYYVAVQTLYLPDWPQQANQLKQWFQYRKVLVVNPQTGAAVVAVIADAGPAKQTGKQFGGSPQVMVDLGLYPKNTKGKVIVLFVDDPHNEVPLGPVTHSAGKPPALI